MCPMMSFLLFFHKHNKELLNKKKVEFEDLTPIIYLKSKVFGFTKKMNIKYMVIDEAQDFSVFQLYALKEIFNTELFTILGDLAQGIHSYRGINNWNEVLEKVFVSGKARFLTLEQSYRTTIEIMDVANDILRLSKILGLLPARPVVRHGKKPCFYRFNSKEKLVEAIENRIIEFRNQKYSTIAVICKTYEECGKVKKLLDKRGKVNVKNISADDAGYEGGTVIVPSFMSKGLEFDAVIIVSLDETYIDNELDFKLLYVAMTRALHHMDTMIMNNTIKCLNHINKDLVNLSHWD